MQQLRFVTKTDKVAELLRAEILKGALPAGSQLRQEDIAARLGVSSTPVREAFGILEVEGFVERRAHRGAVVVGVDTVMLEDSYELRGVLEAFGVERAVARGATTTTLAKVQQVLRRAAKAFKAGQLHQFRVESAEFHRQLVNASGSEALIELHAMLMRRTVFNAPLDRPEMARYQRAHERIYLAMTKGDGEGAADLLTTHMRRVTENVRSAGPAAHQNGKAAAI